MNHLFDIFLSDTKENLRESIDCLLVLEKKPEDHDSLNQLFRMMHTIKGGSNMFELDPFSEVVHTAEDILDRARAGKCSITSEMVDIFFESVDLLSYWLGCLETNHALPKDASSQSSIQKNKIRLMTDEPAKETESIESESINESENIHESQISQFVCKIPESIRMDLIRKMGDTNATLFGITFEPSADCFFHGIDPLNLFKTIPHVIWTSVEPRDQCPELQDYDPYQCILRFFVLCQDDIEHLSNCFPVDSILIDILQFDYKELVIPMGLSTSKSLNDEWIQQAETLIAKDDWINLYAHCDTLLLKENSESLSFSTLQWLLIVMQEPLPDKKILCRLIESIKKSSISKEQSLPNTDDTKCSNETKESKGFDVTTFDAVEAILHAQMDYLQIKINDSDDIQKRIPSVVTILNRLYNLDILKSYKENISEISKKSLDEKNAQYLYDLVAESWVDWKFHEVELGTTKRSIPILNETGTNDSELFKQNDVRAESPLKIENDWKVRKDDIGSKNDTIRILKVDQSRIDVLIDLVGELVVAKNSLPFLAKQAEECNGNMTKISREIKNQYTVINRISNELQSAVFQVRMVPLSHVFQRFNRLVRDLSRKMIKKIRLSIEGEETEIDKNIAENLADPLMHIIRNSVDHGIESPEVREKIGKNIEGEIRLSAFCSDGFVVINIEDDGKGLDVVKIKEKAYQKGIIDEETVERLNDEEAYRLIFEPGFSTSQEISDVSGRGVGMDVVRTMVNHHGGSVSLKSTINEGTSIRLSLPQTMTISHVMMIESRGIKFGVPIESIQESVRIAPDEVHRIKKQETIVLRDRIIPLFHLERFLELEQSNNGNDKHDKSILVVTVGENELGLVVDRFLEGVDIIAKPLEGILKHCPWYTGTALLGDGSVLLILNLEAFLRCQ